MDNSQDIFDYDDLAPQDYKFRWRGIIFTLREPTESAVLAYRSVQLRGAQMVDNKVTSNLDKLYESQSTLVSSCLFQLVRNNKDNTEELQHVKIDVVKSFASRVVKDLFERAKKMGQVDEVDDEESIQKQIAALQDKLSKLKATKDAVKNEPSAGTLTSISPSA